jgi:hypothetical protein
MLSCCVELLSIDFLGSNSADLPGFFIDAQNIRRDWDNFSGYFHTVMSRMDLPDIHKTDKANDN